MMKYKFQMENGNISDGYTTLVIKDGIAEVEDLTRAIEQLIEAHGGQLVKPEPERRRPTKERGD